MTPRLRRRIADGRVAWTVVLIVVLVALGSVPIASAHAELIESAPASGEHVVEPPDEVTLRFSEGVQLATVSVTSANGERVAKEAQIDPQDRSVVHVPLEATENGTYLVRWEVLSADGHTVSGSFFFVVGEELPTREQLLRAYTSDDGDSSGNPAAPVFRALLFGGVVVLVGAPVTLLFVVYPLAREYEIATTNGIPTTAADRATRALFGGALLAVFASAMALALVQLTASGSLSPEGIPRFVTTASGVAWLVRVGVALVLGLLTALVGTSRWSVSTRRWLGALLGGGLLVQLTVSFTSHSAAVTGGPVGTLVDFGHLLGGALWMGGLAVLAILAPRFLARATVDVPQVAAQLIRRFSVLAIAGVALAGATGLAIAAWHVPTVDSLGATLYGTALSAKVVLVVLAVGLGGLNRFVLHRKLRAPMAGQESRMVGWPRLSIIPMFGVGHASSRGAARAFVRSVRLELVILVGVLLLSGLITSIPTAATAVHHDQPANELVLESETDGVTLALTMVPGQVGPNVVTVNVTENGEPARTEVPVTIELAQPARNVTLPPVELDRIGPGSYSTVTTIPTAGTWNLRVSTWTARTHVIDSYTVHVSSAAGGQLAHSHGSHDDSSGRDAGNWFTTLLRLGALGIGVIGTVAVGYEIVGVGLLRR